MKKVVFWVFFTAASFCATAQSQNSVALDSILSPQKTETAGTMVPVIVRIKNVGLGNLHSCDFNYSVNGMTQLASSYLYTNAIGLPSGFSDTVCVDWIILFGNDDVCVWVRMPNGVVDSITYDDTSCISVESCLPSMFSYADTLCYGEVYNDANFSNLTIAGTYYDTLQNISGCDSVIELILSYYPNVNVYNYSDTICDGATYSDAYFSGLTLANTYSDTLQSIHGCDSLIVNFTLTVNPIYFTQISDSISVGDTCNFFGKLLTASGIYYDTLQTIYGCDSIIELTLMVTSVGIVEISYELQVTSYEIYDILGRKAPLSPPEGGKTNTPLNLPSRGENSPFEGGRGMSIDVSHLPAGIYIIKIYTNKGIITKKIIK